MGKVIIATAYLVDGDRSYRPGDVVVGGDVAANVEKYVGLGQVTVTETAEPEPKPEPKPAKKAKKG